MLMRWPYTLRLSVLSGLPPIRHLRVTVALLKRLSGQTTGHTPDLEALPALGGGVTRDCMETGGAANCNRPKPLQHDCL